MARKVFYSFHYDADNWRASQVRNIGAIDGNQPASDNDWESVKRGGDAAIQKWIDGQLAGRTCAIVLIGSQTAERKWVKYEIRKAWEESKGLLGIYVHNLKNSGGIQANKGANPFAQFTLSRDSAKLSEVAKSYDPPFADSANAYNYIKNNLTAWVEEAVRIRSAY